MRTNPLSIIKRRPTLFRTLSGIPIDKFNDLLKQIVSLYEIAESKRLHKEKRERKQGGGSQQNLDLPNQLLMLFMYFRLHISQEFLGLIFNLHNCNVSRGINYL